MLVNLPVGWESDPSNPYAKALEDFEYPYEYLGTGLYNGLREWAFDYLVESEHPFDPMFLEGTPEERIKAVVQQASQDLPHNYGVCDYPTQVLERWPQIEADERHFIILFGKLTRADDSGWRWHKNGIYIGTQNPRSEFLGEEPHIETVWNFRIFQIRSE